VFSRDVETEANFLTAERDPIERRGEERRGEADSSKLLYSREEDIREDNRGQEAEAEAESRVDSVPCARERVNKTLAR
jgi:hypothetical protein